MQKFTYSALVVVILISLSACERKADTSFITLYTPKQQQIDLNLIQDTAKLPVLIDLKRITKNEIKDRSRVYANLYLATTGRQDTILLLDTSLASSNIDIKSVNPWAEITPTTHFDHCAIAATQQEIQSLKRYNYIYCKVKMVIDD